MILLDSAIDSFIAFASSHTYFQFILLTLLIQHFKVKPKVIKIKPRIFISALNSFLSRLHPGTLITSVCILAHELLCQLEFTVHLSKHCYSMWLPFLCLHPICPFISLGSSFTISMDIVIVV